MSTLTIQDYLKPFQGNHYYYLGLPDKGLGNSDLAVLIAQLTPEQKLKVRKLDLSYNQISDLGSISELVGLEYLDFKGNSVTDLSALSGLVGLKSLIFNNNLVSNLKPISGLVGLKCLYLINNPIASYSPLDNLPDCRVYR